MVETVFEFLACATPDAWIKTACENQDILLLDHAHCERKAATTALSLIHRDPENPNLSRLSKLAREELRHFEQVLVILKQRNITYRKLTASRYAGQLMGEVRAHSVERFVDTLVVAAFIEARSCERFSVIAPYLDAQLEKFYCGLLASEARHFQVYLKMAQAYSEVDISERVAYFREKEAMLILSEDPLFRFHSGVPTL